MSFKSGSSIVGGSSHWGRSRKQKLEFLSNVIAKVRSPSRLGSQSLKDRSIVHCTDCHQGTVADLVLGPGLHPDMLGADRAPSCCSLFHDRTQVELALLPHRLRLLLHGSFHANLPVCSFPSSPSSDDAPCAPSCASDTPMLAPVHPATWRTRP